jgi:hypothetical protein
MDVKAIAVHVIRKFDHLTLRAAIAQIINHQDNTDLTAFSYRNMLH